MMKHLNKVLFLVLAAVIAFTSCSKSNNDDYEKYIKEEQRKDSIERARVKKLIAEQAPGLKDYVMDAANGWTKPLIDTATGIWFELENAGNVDAYKYKLVASNNQLYIQYPKVEVHYTGNLLNGTQFDATKADTPAKFQLGYSVVNNMLIPNVIDAWHRAFLPQKITFGTQDYNTGGLTLKGLQPGSIIRIAAPSVYGYDATAKGSIPANSPLVFRIEVIKVED